MWILNLFFLFSLIKESCYNTWTSIKTNRTFLKESKLSEKQNFLKIHLAIRTVNSCENFCLIMAKAQNLTTAPDILTAIQKTQVKIRHSHEESHAAGYGVDMDECYPGLYIGDLWVYYQCAVSWPSLPPFFSWGRGKIYREWKNWGVLCQRGVTHHQQTDFELVSDSASRGV